MPNKNNSNININNNIHLKNNIYNNYFINNTNFPINNIDNEFSFGLSLSNTTKNKISNKTQVKYCSNCEKDNTININKNKEQYIFKKNIFNDKNNTLNNFNYTLNNNNYTLKKNKYTTLMEKLDNKTSKVNHSLSNNSQTIRKSSNIFKDSKIKLNLNKKINQSKAGSSLIEPYQSLMYNTTYENKINNQNSHVSRSKSTGNFITITKMSQKPKTPKGHFIFDKKVIVGPTKEFNKNKKDSINGFSKTTRNIYNN
jgi:hypothetical protein